MSKNTLVSVIDQLPKRSENPFLMGYYPELDVYPELGLSEASYYQFLIEVIRWMVEIRQVDINTKVPILESYGAMPRKKFLETTIHVTDNLKLKHKS